MMCIFLDCGSENNICHKSANACGYLISVWYLLQFQIHVLV